MSSRPGLKHHLGILSIAKKVERDLEVELVLTNFDSKDITY